MSSSGRPPRVRESYEADAQGLISLARAISADSLRPFEWREDMVAQLTAMARMLLAAPPARAEE